MSDFDDFASRMAAAGQAAATLEELHRWRKSRSAAFAEAERAARRRHEAGESARSDLAEMAAFDAAATVAEEAALAVIAELIARFELPPADRHG